MTGRFASTLRRGLQGISKRTKALRRRQYQKAVQGKTMRKTPSNRNSNSSMDRARTKTVVRNAVSEVKAAAGAGSGSNGHANGRSSREGLTWLLSLGAGALAAWKIWHTDEKHLPDGHDNATAKRFQAELEREKRVPARLASAAPHGTTTTQADTRPAFSPSKPEPDTAEHAPRTENETPNDSGGMPKVDNSPAAIGKEFYKRFNEDEITTRAAALAFVGVFSLVPILLFAVIALGFVFRDPAEANRHVQQFVTQLLPGESASKAAGDVLAQTHLVETAQGMTKHLGWPLVIGVASLLWAGISLFVTAAVPMNTAWDVTETRSFIKLRLVALGVLFGAGLVFLLSLGVSALPRVVANFTPPLFGFSDGPPVWASVFFTLLAVALDALMFVLIYKFLPNIKVTWKVALFSGVATGLLWEAFKQVFAYYLAHFGNTNNKLYGALGGVVLLITWIYYSCIILLAGAIIGKMYHERREAGGVTERAPRTA